MEKIYLRSLLYDFYGELLTEKQKKVYEDVVMNDMSYSEVAWQNDITRQGIYDMIKRIDKTLEEYEQKLGLMSRFMKVKEETSNLDLLVDKLKEQNDNKNLDRLIDEIKSISGSILEDY